MGHKVHPFGFRIGVIRDWQAKWYAEKDYVAFLQEDMKLRQAIQSRYTEAGISLVEIERQSNKVSVTIHTARPGVVIGRGGQRVDEMRLMLENLIGKRIQLNVLEVQQPELDAYLVGRAIAEQIEHRVAFRRAMKQALFRTMQSGAKGIRISCAGRLGGVEIARREVTHQGQVPLHTLRADIDYGFTEAHTALGRIGIKVWIYRGDILPEPSLLGAEEAPAEGEEAEAAEAKTPTPPKREAKPKAEKPAEAVAPPAKIKPKAEKKTKEKAEVEVAETKAEKETKKEATEAKAEAKTSKPKTKKTTAKTKPAVTEDKEETDATTQAGEVPQEP
ncbi:MAG: 30S ribosomal protein S3 [Deltaproteobacteria bacterium]|nr:30S ribosomal protein S3 [Deltaproteobacteria bacterium]